MRFDRSPFSECKNCPLKYRNRVWGEGPESFKMAFIGEAPGAHEDYHKRPFVGPAGGWFDKGLSRAEIRRQNVWLANVLPCRPPSNDIESDEALEAMHYCGPGLKKEIEWILTHGAKVIVPLGNTAYLAILPDAKGSITKSRGSVFLGPKDVPVIPTWHPAALMRDQRMWDVWVADLEKAKEVSVSWKPPKEDFFIAPTLSQLKKWARGLKDDSLIAVDIETTSFDPDKGEIIVVGLADSSERAVSFPFLSKGGKSYWSFAEEKEVRKLLQKVLKNHPTIFQNAKFDIRWLEENGFPVGKFTHDVMLMHHAIHTELPHNLGFIASIYGVTPYWKEEVLGRESRLLEIENHVLRTYNARDAVVLHQVFPGLLSDMKELDVASTYAISRGLVRPILSMEKKGILLTHARLETWKRFLVRSLKKQDAFLLEDLHPSFNLDSDDDVRLLLYDHVADKFLRAEEEIKRKKRTDTLLYKKLHNLLEVRETTKPLMLPYFSRIKTTESGKPSVDEESLLSIKRACLKWLNPSEKRKYALETTRAKRESLKRTLAWVNGFLEHNRLSKLLSTYTSYPTRSDGRVHSSFLIHGTATGRLSSKDPNLQNVPEEARHIFIASPGCTFISADYVNLELIVLAYVSNDLVLIKTFKEGRNIHDENTKILFKVNPEDPHFKGLRRAAKIYIFGRNYGGGLEGIYQRVLLEAPDVDLSFSDFREADESYRKEHPAYDKWRDEVLGKVRETRMLTTCFGRRRIFLGSPYEIEKEGLNYLIQSPAADVINHALIKVHKEFEKRELKAKVVLQVHDQLLVECPKRELLIVIRILKECMEWEVAIGQSKVCFPVEISEGPSWGELAPVSVRRKKDKG